MAHNFFVHSPGDAGFPAELAEKFDDGRLGFDVMEGLLSRVTKEFVRARDAFLLHARSFFCFSNSM